jgi:toxin YoeB
MSFNLDFSEQSKKDIDFYKKTGNKAILKKLLFLLEELAEHPFEGTGKPEALKHQLSGLWSRRINREHRLLYQVSDDVVYILSVKDHY